MEAFNAVTEKMQSFVCVGIMRDSLVTDMDFLLDGATLDMQLVELCSTAYRHDLGPHHQEATTTNQERCTASELCLEAPVVYIPRILDVALSNCMYVTATCGR